MTSTSATHVSVSWGSSAGNVELAAVEPPCQRFTVRMTNCHHRAFSPEFKAEVVAPCPQPGCWDPESRLVVQTIARPHGLLTLHPSVLLGGPDQNSAHDY